MATSDTDNELRVVLVGEQGSGKSSLGNNLLRGNHFKSTISAASETGTCDYGNKIFDCNRKLVIIDTPGLFDTRTPNVEMTEERQKCLVMTTPGPHVFLVTIEIGRCTREEDETLKILEETFGESMMPHVIIVFTHADLLEENNVTLEKYLQNKPDSLTLTRWIAECGGRYTSINNKAMGRQKESDVKMIMDLSKKTADRQAHYTSDVYKELERNMIGADREQVREDTMHGRFLEYVKGVSEKAFADVGIALGVASFPELRVVLIGKTGSGKSLLGNNLLEENKFKSTLSAASETGICDYGNKIIDGNRKLVIIDAPGLFDTRKPNKEISKEILKCLIMTTPGPHVFLMSIKIGRFTREEDETLEILYEMFGKTVMPHVIIVFTHGDLLEEKNVTLEEYLQNKPDALTRWLIAFEERYTSINNKAKGRKKESDVKMIMDLIKKTADKQAHYTSEVYRELERNMIGVDRELVRKDARSGHIWKYVKSWHKIVAGAVVSGLAIVGGIVTFSADIGTAIHNVGVSLSADGWKDLRD